MIGVVKAYGWFGELLGERVVVMDACGGALSFRDNQLPIQVTREGALRFVTLTLPSLDLTVNVRIHESVLVSPHNTLTLWHSEPVLTVSRTW